LKTLPLSEARTKLGRLIDEIQGRDEAVTITRNGRPVAVLVSADEFDSWRETLSIRADERLCDEIGQGLDEIKERNAKLYAPEDLFD
jgi:prevent-host-death family protein